MTKDTSRLIESTSKVANQRHAPYSDASVSHEQLSSYSEAPFKHHKMNKYPSKNILKQIERSPFFRPTDPKQLQPIVTRDGRVKLAKQNTTDKEHKSTIIGAVSNIVNVIAGAGIVGIPFALRESGLVAGIILILLCAAITEKTLRLLIETAKHIDVSSYEILMEASFGRPGFIFISCSMFLIAYGSTIAYLLVIKDTLPILCGVNPDDEFLRRWVLVVSSLFIILPLSTQRDMADLSKTSQVSVVFTCLIVLIITTFSPTTESLSLAQQTDNIQKNNNFLTGAIEIFAKSIVRPSTIFIGLGVLSFVFVPHHASFIIAGSLDRPNRERWSKVTHISLSLCAFLAIVCGVAGYLGFLDTTEGNVLNNFINMAQDKEDHATEIAVNVARTLLCISMFFVYPMDLFVARHILVVFLFKGRIAHEGDDHAVLARWDRRICLTTGLYLITLIPALFLNDLGPVLALTGAIAGSSLSSIGPGLAYLAVHGREFIKLVEEHSWLWGGREQESVIVRRSSFRRTMSMGSCNSKMSTGGTQSVRGVLVSLDEYPLPSEQKKVKIAKVFRCKWPESVQNVPGTFLWYALQMPLWVFVAELGERRLLEYAAKEFLKSPRIPRLGRVYHKRPLIERAKGIHTPEASILGLADYGLANGAMNSSSSLLISRSVGDFKSCNTENQKDMRSTFSDLTDIPMKSRTLSVECELDGPLTIEDDEGGYQKAGIGCNPTDSHNERRSHSFVEKIRHVTSMHEIEDLEKTPMVFTGPSEYGTMSVTTAGGNRGIAAAISQDLLKKKENLLEEEDDPQAAFPSAFDFSVAILLIWYGFILMLAGCSSVLCEKK